MEQTSGDHRNVAYADTTLLVDCMGDDVAHQFRFNYIFFRHCKTASCHRRTTQFLAAFLTLAFLRILMPLLLIIINSFGSSSSIVATDFVREFGFYPSSLQQVGQFVYHSMFPIAVWMVVNTLFDLMGTNLYSKMPVKVALDKDKNFILSPQNQDLTDKFYRQDNSAQNLPVFLNNTPNINVNDIIAISAEDHYVRVVTQHKETLIYCRFSDCLHEMRTIEGMRIHRSHWARKDAINKIERKGRKAMVRFSNGLTLPVSQTYLGSLEQLKVA